MRLETGGDCRFHTRRGTYLQGTKAQSAVLPANGRPVLRVPTGAPAIRRTTSCRLNFLLPAMAGWRLPVILISSFLFPSSLLSISLSRASSKRTSRWIEQRCEPAALRSGKPRAGRRTLGPSSSCSCVSNGGFGLGDAESTVTYPTPSQGRALERLVRAFE